jgi:hypothetical protein
VVFLVFGGHEFGNELVATFADLAAGLFEADAVSEFHHRFVPGKRVEIHRVQQCPVQVEDRGFRHL